MESVIACSPDSDGFTRVMVDLGSRQDESPGSRGGTGIRRGNEDSDCWSRTKDP